MVNCSGLLIMMESATMCHNDTGTNLHVLVNEKCLHSKAAVVAKILPNLYIYMYNFDNLTTNFGINNSRSSIIMLSIQVN